MIRLALYIILLLFVALPIRGATAPPRAAGAAPAAGLHTIRADDTLVHMAADGGFAWLIQLVEWREIEPVAGEYFLGVFRLAGQEVPPSLER